MSGRRVKVKVSLIGDPSVGKTSLVRRFVYSKFDDTYISTLGTKITQKTVELDEDSGTPSTEVTMMVWDISGQKEFQRIHLAGLKNSNGAFIVTDFTRRETLLGIGYWTDSIRNAAGDIPIILIANKSDLRPEQREFSPEEFESIGSKYTDHTLITSAKSGDNVDKAFQKLAEVVMIGGRNLTATTGVEDAPPSKLDNLFALEDRMIAEFCDFLGDEEMAMMVVRQQYDKLHLDFREPTLEGLRKVAEGLINAAVGFKDEQSISRYKRDLRKLFDQLEQDE